MSEALEFKLKKNKNFQDNALDYLEKNISIIPDKFMSKQPAIKAWSDYCYRLPTKEEIESWSLIGETNIAICLGTASGIIALDIDADDEKILNVVMPLLPDSPVVKKGAKGETRFFRFTGEASDSLKFNGSMVVEILSNGKKTTIPPSVHPSGESYTWTSEKTLLDIKASELPLLPPFLFSVIAQKLKQELPQTFSESFNKISNGRNDTLSSLCGKLIAEGKTVDQVLRDLIDFDEKNNVPPLFTDPSENRHTEAYSNALQFYANHLASINTRRYRESKEYELPVMTTSNDLEKIKEVRMGKLVGQVKQKNANVEALLAPSVLKNIWLNLLENSWIKQEDLSLGATLALFSTLCSRKVVFQGMSPNLYILNVAASGSGKDAPQQMIKNILMDIGADSLLGAGDYVSDASLMDSLSVSPVRLDIMDEAGGILRTVNSGRSEYNGKMADVLAELYTTSNNKYLGRATAEGRKGSCYRPNVNILASTTPTGFMEGVSLKAIEKGLMGRFLIFTGASNKKAERLKTFPKLKHKELSVLRHWFAFRPEDYITTSSTIGGIPQNYVELEADKEANEMLDSIFNEFDNLRITTEPTSPLLPIIARLYQQMIKLVIISACSECNNGVPEIVKKDVVFGHSLILYYYETVKEVVNKYIFSNSQEKDTLSILNIIEGNGGEITKSELSRLTRNMNKKQRESIIEDLIDSETIIRDIKNSKGKNQTVYILLGR